jgi:hypothetical protein
MRNNILDESLKWFLQEGSGLAAIGQALRVFHSSSPPEATSKQDNSWLHSYYEVHRTDREFWRLM